MTKTCSTCRYHRPAGYMDAGIYGHGSWCSNSKSEEFRSRTKASDTCDKHEPKKPAPWYVKLIKWMLE